METILEIRQATGLNRKQFSDALRIPYRTVEDWEKGARACPAYVAELIAYRVQRDPTFRNGQSTDQTIKTK